MATRIYTHAAGEAKNYGGGRFLKIQDANSAVNVELQSKDGTTIDIIDGLTLGDSVTYADGFAQAVITSPSAQVVTVQVLQVVLASNNLVGNISAVTRLDNLSDDLEGFIGVGGQIGAYIGLYNPSGSGKDLIIRAIGFASSNAALSPTNNVSLRFSTSLGSMLNMTSTFSYLHNKKLGQANGAGQMYYGGTSPGGFIIGGMSVVQILSGNMMLPAQLGSRPIVVPPGYLCYAGDGSYNLAAHFEWDERATV